jgi:hypothetical protein
MHAIPTTFPLDLISDRQPEDFAPAFSPAQKYIFVMCGSVPTTQPYPSTLRFRFRQSAGETLYYNHLEIHHDKA